MCNAFQEAPNRRHTSRNTISSSVKYVVSQGVEYFVNGRQLLTVHQLETLQNLVKDTVVQIETPIEVQQEGSKDARVERKDIRKTVGSALDRRFGLGKKEVKEVLPISVW